jgi:hypothetical protein
MTGFLSQHKTDINHYKHNLNQHPPQLDTAIQKTTNTINMCADVTTMSALLNFPSQIKCHMESSMATYKQHSLSA